MDAPKCRLCGERHYGACKTWAGSQRQEPCAGCASKEAVIAQLRAELDKRKTERKTKASNESNGSNGFDKRAYQREYMKAYRARNKDGP